MIKELKNIIRDKTASEGYIVTISIYKNGLFYDINHPSLTLYNDIPTAQAYIDKSIEEDIMKMNTGLDPNNHFYYKKDNKIYSYIDDSVLFEYNIIHITASCLSEYNGLNDNANDNNILCLYRSNIRCLKKRILQKPKTEMHIVKYVLATSDIDANTKMVEWFHNEYKHYVVDPNYDYTIELPQKVNEY